MEARDIPALAALERACFSEPWSERSFKHQLDSDTARILAAERDGRIIGLAGLLHVLDEGAIANIAVAPDCRRQGVGRALLRALLALAGELDLASVTLEVRESNLPAQALYLGEGFKPLGIRRGFYAKPAEDAVTMGIRLRPDRDQDSGIRRQGNEETGDEEAGGGSVPSSFS